MHPQGNPHWWLSPTEARKVARGLEARLELLSPTDAASFQHGLVRLLSEIDAAETEARGLLTGFQAPPLVTFHVTFSYFFGVFGLKPAAFIEPRPGLPPTPSHVASLVAGLTGRSPLFLVEPYFDADVPRDLASKTGGRVVVVPSGIGGTDGAKTYRDLIRTIARAVRGE
jgi:zinc/manganese transport system substrate-binding protein